MTHSHFSHDIVPGTRALFYSIQLHFIITPLNLIPALVCKYLNYSIGRIVVVSLSLFIASISLSLTAHRGRAPIFIWNISLMRGGLGIDLEAM